MKTLADLLTPEELAGRTTPANRRLGAAIVAEGGVALEVVGARDVRAIVGGTPSSPTRRHVQLRTIPETGLDWSCTCSSKGDFCKHVVAAAIAVRKG